MYYVGSNKGILLTGFIINIYLSFLSVLLASCYFCLNTELQCCIWYLIMAHWLYLMHMCICMQSINFFLFDCIYTWLNGMFINCELVILFWIKLMFFLYLPTWTTFQCLMVVLTSGNGRSTLSLCLMVLTQSEWKNFLPLLIIVLLQKRYFTEMGAF